MHRTLLTVMATALMWGVVVGFLKWSTSDQKMVQIDVGPEDVVWGVASKGRVFVMPNDDDKWEPVPDGEMKQVTYGKSGVWGVNNAGRIFYRQGVTSKNPAGSSWKMTDGSNVRQIDSGPTGILFLVNNHNQIYCRDGITDGNPTGTKWRHVPGTLKRVSCGIYGCWGVNAQNTVWFLGGIGPCNCAGTAWKHISGGIFEQLEVNQDGMPYAVTTNKGLWVREGVTATNPIGTSWRYLYSPSLYRVTAGSSAAVYGINTSWRVTRYKGDT